MICRSPGVAGGGSGGGEVLFKYVVEINRRVFVSSCHPPPPQDASFRGISELSCEREFELLDLL